MKDGFKKLRKNTTTSSSFRHLGRYKSLLTFDDEKDKSIESFNVEMITVYNIIINAVIALGALLNRWSIYSQP